MARCDDGFDPLSTASEILTDALRLGGRATGTTDHAGTYALLACAVRYARMIPGLDDGADFHLERALMRAESEGTGEPEDQADTLREGIEQLLGHGEPDDEDPIAPLTASKSLINRAISIGAPAYNAGDHQGCYDVYSCTARVILATLAVLPDPAADRLRAALAECLEMDDPDSQAWAMRYGFDDVLQMSTVNSAVPHEVRDLLSVAISIGAPVFNAGDHRSCYETYAGTARSLVDGNAPEAVKDVRRARGRGTERQPDPPGVDHARGVRRVTRRRRVNDTNQRPLRVRR